MNTCTLQQEKHMDAFSSFYLAHRNKLFGYLMRWTGDYQLSSDIVQESFTRLLSRYGPKQQSVSLLFKIARNAVLDEIRRNARQTGRPAEEKKEATNPEQQVLIREEYRKAFKAIQRLAADEKEILALTVSSNLTYREIASIIGISEANVKVKVHRARIKIKQILERGD